MPLKAAYIVPHPPLAVPEVGLGQEQEIASTLDAFHAVARRIVAHAPASLVFISPHSAYYGDWIYIASGEGAVGDLTQFGAPDVRFSLAYDHELRDRIVDLSHSQDVPAGYVEDHARALDHGLMVPLYFIEKAHSAWGQDWHYQSVSIGGSALPASTLLEFGRCLTRAIDAYAKDIVLVVSGDLSHKLRRDGPYGFDPAGPTFDEEFRSIVKSGDLMRFVSIDPTISKAAGECGLSGFIMMAGSLDEATQQGQRFSSELLSLEGPFGVGYGVAAFEEETAEQ